MKTYKQTPYGMDLAMKLPGRIFTISIIITTGFLIAFICSPYNEFIAEALFFTAFAALSINCMAFVVLLIYAILNCKYFLSIMGRAAVFPSSFLLW